MYRVRVVLFLSPSPSASSVLLSLFILAGIIKLNSCLFGTGRLLPFLIPGASGSPGDQAVDTASLLPEQQALPAALRTRWWVSSCGSPQPVQRSTALHILLPVLRLKLPASLTAYAVDSFRFPCWFYLIYTR